MASERKDINWSALRESYETGKMSLRQLSATYGVSKTYIIERRDKGGWSKPSTDRPVTTQGRQPTDAIAASRLALALSLCAQKLSYEDIAQRCGYADRSVAYNAVHRALKARIPENVDELRREESLMLDQLHAEVWPLAMDKENKGRLFAVDRIIEISKERRKLMNIDKKPAEEATQQNYTKRIILSPTISSGGDNGSSNS